VRVSGLRESITIIENGKSFFSPTRNEMETLASDMAQLMTSNKKSTSLMEVVGADVNSSYDRSM
jgi:hypothetical protein